MTTEARRAPRTFPTWVLQGLVGLDPLAAWAFAYQEPDRDAPGSRGEMNGFKTEPRPGLLSRLLAAYHDISTARPEREVFADHRRELDVGAVGATSVEFHQSGAYPLPLTTPVSTPPSTSLPVYDSRPGAGSS